MRWLYKVRLKAILSRKKGNNSFVVGERENDTWYLIFYFYFSFYSEKVSVRPSWTWSKKQILILLDIEWVIINSCKLGFDLDLNFLSIFPSFWIWFFTKEKLGLIYLTDVSILPYLYMIQKWVHVRVITKPILSSHKLDDLNRRKYFVVYVPYNMINNILCTFIMN